MINNEQGLIKSQLLIEQEQELILSLMLVCTKTLGSRNHPVTNAWNDFE